MKINLVLSGGAARGAFHLGVLEAMDRLGFEIERISGSSIGAIIATSYASGIAPKEQLEIFYGDEFKKIFKFNYFNRGLFRIDEHQAIIEKLSPVKKLEDLSIPVYIAAIDLISGEVLYFNKGDSSMLCIASCSLVPLFKPVNYLGYELVDGGIMDNLPISPLLGFGEPIIGVDLHPMQIGFKNSLLGILERSMFLGWRASVKPQIKNCSLYISDGSLSDFSLFSFKKLQKMFDLGYERGSFLLEEYLKKEQLLRGL